MTKLVKIDKKKSQDDLIKDFNSTIDRKQGRWKNLCEEIIETKKGAEVTDITRGQAWSLKRTAEGMKVRVKILDKGKRVILLPPK